MQLEAKIAADLLSMPINCVRYFYGMRVERSWEGWHVGNSKDRGVIAAAQTIRLYAPDMVSTR